jgi:hypothetical protein
MEIIGDMVWPEADWTHSPESHDTDGDWGKVDKEIGGVAHHLLDLLSQDVAPLEADVHGWTQADSYALGLTQEVDWLARLLVPPDAVSADHRMEFIELMATFRAALPFAEAERNWLLDEHRFDDEPGGPGSPCDERWLEIARKSETQLVSAGLSRVVHGRDLLQRWWSWRRETGEYAGQESLGHARDALRGIIGLVAPELGLPETSVAEEKQALQ